MNVINLRSIKQREIVPGYFARFVHSDNMSIAYWNIKAGSSLPEHSHKHEQICTVIDGEFELNVEGKSNLLQADEVFVIPSNVVHSGKALTDCKLIDIFYPVREDYR